MSNFKTYDTFATTTYKMVRIADVKVFGEGKDRNVVVVFCDNSKAKGTLEALWVDAYVDGDPDYTSLYQKGDIACITGKLRLKVFDDGKIRGRMYDATIESFAPIGTRKAAGIAPDPESAPEPDPSDDEVDNAFGF